MWKAKARAKTHADTSNLAQKRAEAVPTEDKSLAWLASLADES